ncbi:interleukin-15-like isoform X1 [Xyrichtys novacula]|uniref:Interleukin-15-like isoform X1 n=1 Tax=Xyrichtys novacula TaxID=13765 RepID=A0AAV1EUA3_XYRNO|nr:interleukin-15-like isoform X1 [Xyrichtys novacula]
MTAPPVILVKSTYPGDRNTKCIQFQLACNLCSESHKTQVWLCFLILSLLSSCSSAVSVRDITHLQICLDRLKPYIQNSDAMLYAPSSADVKKDCKMMSLQCYMLELKMVTVEEEIMDERSDCIFDFYDILPPEATYVSPVYKILI